MDTRQSQAYYVYCMLMKLFRLVDVSLLCYMKITYVILYSLYFMSDMSKQMNEFTILLRATIYNFTHEAEHDVGDSDKKC